MIDSDATVLVNTAEANCSKYLYHEYYRALDSRKLQYNLYILSHKYLLKIIDNKAYM